MRKVIFLGLTLVLALAPIPALFAEEVNMDVPYGDREAGGYQHLTTHYHNYWRHHHHPWSNIERDRWYVRKAQDLAEQTKVYEGCCREEYVHLSDNTVRERFNEYMWGGTNMGQAYSAELPAHLVDRVKNRTMISPSVRDSIQMHQVLPSPLNYNNLTYLPDEFTRKQLRMPSQRYRSGLAGNDLVLYDEVTGRVRGLWRDVIH